MATTSTPPALAEVQHEHFCLPRPGEQGPRIEGFTSFADTPGGKSYPVAFTTRCLECGATTYNRLETAHA